MANLTDLENRMSINKEFEKELSELLNRYGMAIICESQKNEDDTSVQIGFQDCNFRNTWVGRHHVTGYDLNS